MKHFMNEDWNKGYVYMKEKTYIEKTLLIIGAVLLFFSFFILAVIKWVAANYGELAFENIIFQLTTPSEGADPVYFQSFIIDCILFPLLYVAIGLLLVVPIMKKRFNLSLKLFGNERNISLYPFQLLRKLFFPLGIFLFAYSLNHANDVYHMKYFFDQNRTDSTFIEDHYVDPQKANVLFPETKRNLVYISLESMENTFMSKEYGGAQPENLIPELTALAEQNTNFSQDSGIGGAIETTGGRNTISSTISQLTGIPLKLPLTLDSQVGKDSYLPGAYAIGDILNQNGYKQMLLQGSEGSFAGVGVFFETHGNYDIYDLERAKADHKEQEPISGWGLKDYEVYAIAKEQLLTLSQGNQPFNLTIVTLDTHAPDGRLCPLCENKSEVQYENVLSCASKQVDDFVKWIQQQEFYANTTIVIVGDHPSMAPDYFNELSPEYMRRTYNAIINPAIKTDFAKNRSFSKMDMYPTTIASLGATIEGDHLALGTNLLSGKKTLIEEVGFERFNEEIEKHSPFYDHNLLQLSE